MDSIITGIFALVGVVIGGVTSFMIALYNNKKDYQIRILEKKQILCLGMLTRINDMIDRLPKNLTELPSFKEFLMSEFNKECDKKTCTEEMIYVSQDIRTTYIVICTFASNDFIEGKDFTIINSQIILYRNILVEQIQEYLNLPNENSPWQQKKQNKKFDNLYKQKLSEVEND